MKPPERLQTSHIVLVFPVLSSNKEMLTGYVKVGLI